MNGSDEALGCDRYPKNIPLADQKEKSLAFSSRCFRVEVHHPQRLIELAQQMAHSPISVYIIRVLEQGIELIDRSTDWITRSSSPSCESTSKTSGSFGSSRGCSKRDISKSGDGTPPTVVLRKGRLSAPFCPISIWTR